MLMLFHARALKSELPPEPVLHVKPARQGHKTRAERCRRRIIKCRQESARESNRLSRSPTTSPHPSNESAWDKNPRSRHWTQSGRRSPPCPTRIPSSPAKEPTLRPHRSTG